MGQGQGPFLLLPVGIAQHSIAGVWKCCSLVAGQALTAASRLLTIGQGLKSQNGSVDVGQGPCRGKWWELTES